MKNWKSDNKLEKQIWLAYMKLSKTVKWISKELKYEQKRKLYDRKNLVKEVLLSQTTRKEW